MGTKKRRDPIRWLCNSSRAQIGLGVVLLLGLLAWWAPRRVDEIASVGQHEVWQTATGPTIREVVWESPRPFEKLQNDADAQFVTPFLTDNGATLYFSRRSDGHADIFVTRLVDGQWQPATSVAVLNSDAEDLGATLSSDGSELYFYSNRAGGIGGTDLYVARRTAKGWSTPENVGDSVNSTADEFDPALSPDGKTLYLASNRSDLPVPKQRVAGDKSPWSTTLRAQSTNQTFDLFHATREANDEVWQPATAIAEVNQADSSEGAAFVSPDGGFLYFASDRTQRSGEPRNLDLFRAAIVEGEFSTPESLGVSINTQADETEPALSPEGFTLAFSSNRAGVDQLYRSRAVEVEHRNGWSTAHLPSRRSTWIIGLSILLAALVALAIWRRDRVAQRLWPARFIIGSIVINVVLLVMLAVWRFPEVMDAVAKVFEDSLPAPEMLDESGHQSHEDGREAYEKVADLKSLEAESIPEVASQVTELTSIPEPNQRLAPTISAAAARALPADQVMFVPPKQQPSPTPTPRKNSPFERRRPTRPAEALAMLDIPDTELPAEALPEEAPPTETAPTIAPTSKPFAEVVPTKAALLETPEPVRPVTAANVPMKSTTPEDQPTVRNAPTNPFQRRARNTSVSIADAETKLPELPNQQPLVADNPLEQADSPLDRTAQAQASKPLPVVSLSVTETTIAPRPGARVQPISVSETKLPQTSIQLANPFSSRKRPGRPVAVVASVDEQVSDVLAASEIVAEPTVSGTRPEFKRTTGSTEVASTVARSAPKESLAPTTGVSQFNPVAADTQQAEKLLASTSATRSPMQLPRRRTPRRVSAVATISELDPAQPEQVEAVPGASVLETADANVDRKLAAAEASSGSTQPSSSTSLFETLANQLQAKEQLRETPVVTASISPIHDPLSRRRSAVRDVVRSPATQPEDEADAPTGGTIAEDESVPMSDTVLERSKADLVTDIATPTQKGGPSTTVKNRIVVGELSERANDAPPALSPVASRLNRKRARAMKVALANDNVGLQALFTLRQGDTRRKHIELLGGSEETEKAVNLGLDWLAKNQSADGSWDLRKHQAATQSMTAGTGLGVLPFLAAGYTHNHAGKYKLVVEKAVQRLIANQQESGELTSKGDAQRMYTHGIAAIALCEAFGMSQDAALKGPAQKALDFIVAAQHKPSGGWRYKPNERADTSVVGWQMMALKSGEMAGLKVPPASYQLVSKWLSSVESKKGAGGTFGYQNRNPTPAMTAEGLLCLQFMGTQRNDPRILSGADYVLRSLPKKGQQLTSYYWYYATQAMYHMQGDYWNAWNDHTSELLIQTQLKTGKNAGTWNPVDNWEKSGGRVYATSLKLLMLEVYYRHLPLYEELEF